MLLQESVSPPSSFAPLRSGILAVGILWVLAIWSAGSTGDIGVVDLESNGLVTAQDIGLHASGDYAPSIKRFYARHADQSSALKLSDPFWNFHATDIRYSLPIFFRRQRDTYIYLRAFSQHHLQALNAPRAPPLV